MPTFALGIPLNETVGAYAICWQYALASAAVPIGELYLHGAKPLDFDTRVGQRTQISLNGSGLTPSNMLLLAEGHGMCNASRALVFPGWPSFPVGTQSEGQPGNTSFMYDLLTATSGTVGNFSICWSHSNTSAFVYLGVLEVRDEIPKADIVAASISLGMSASSLTSLTNGGRRLNLEGRSNIELTDEAAGGIEAAIAAFLDMSVDYVLLTAAAQTGSLQNVALDVAFEVSTVGDTTVVVAQTLQEASDTGASDFAESFDTAMQNQGLNVTTTGVSFEPPVVTFFQP
jgi:hypothetical protein